MHQSIEAFEKGLVDERPDDRAFADLCLCGAEGRRSVCQRRAEPDGRSAGAAWSFRRRTGAPICGKDFKTGQTLIKTVLAPAFKARMLGVAGWYSTNILGNRDGEVLDDPESFKTKEESKLGVLDFILQPELYPDLYGDIYHKVRINYYPPRGDNKEGWDNIDIFGWLGYPMQIKVDFLCRDSILAAPLALDLVLFLDLAKRTPELKHLGIQEWLSFFFKSPHDGAGAVSGARSVHPVDEAEEHAAAHHGRGFDHAPGAGVLRLVCHLGGRAGGASRGFASFGRSRSQSWAT